MDGPVMTGRYPYGAWLIKAALCDLVDGEDGTMESSEDGSAVRFSLPVYGNRSRFELLLTDRPAGHGEGEDACDLTLCMRAPAADLSKEGMRRAMHYVLDSVVQRIENELMNLGREPA